VLTCSSEQKCEVKLESSGRIVEVALHCILPLGMCDGGLCVCVCVCVSARCVCVIAVCVCVLVRAGYV
jgi:hypothetical protein